MSKELVTVAITLPLSALGSLYAYAGTLNGEGNANVASPRPTPPTPANVGTAGAGAGTPSSTPEAGNTSSENTDSGQSATNGASPSDAETDAAGVVWDANRHASTKGKTKDGLWRMKVGVSRPAEEGLPAGGNAAAPSSTSGTASGSPAPVEEDEFAQFASGGSAADTPARTWTDADLSKLCNQAATKDGNPDRVRVTITKFVPEGQVPHSRNVPADQREAFAQDVEATIGIAYAG